MTAVDLLGRPLADKLKAKAAEDVRTMASRGFVPRMAIINAASDPACAEYAAVKVRQAAKLGIDTEIYDSGNARLASADDFLHLLDTLSARRDIQGIFIERPLPAPLDGPEWIAHLPAVKDVEGIHPQNLGRLFMGSGYEGNFCVPATAMACIKILEYYGIDIAGKRAAVVGRSLTVGRPLGSLLLNGDATITVCHSRTENLADITSQADILISAVGHPGLITADMVAEGAVVIDVGTNYTADGKVVGDTDYENVRLKASAITPPRGGVGPVTTALLLGNMVQAALADSSEL